MPYHEAYRKLWIDAGYPADLGSACVVKPPPREFRAAYHFTEFEYAKSDIENAWLKVTRISETNDPFEFLAFKPKPTTVLTVMRKMRADADARLRLLCFSRDWRSPALWAHYASRHKGICLGFWVKRGTLHDVTYHVDRIETGFAANAPAAFSPRMKEMLLIAKADDWRYEEETRRFLNVNETCESGKDRFFRFDNSLRLSEVILGENCSKKQFDAMHEMVRNKYKNVAVYKARSAIGFFKMVPDEKTIPA